MMSRGFLAGEGSLADLVGYPADPLAADPDDLAGLTFRVHRGQAPGHS
jgi:hypothetical protein